MATFPDDYTYRGRIIIQPADDTLTDEAGLISIANCATGFLDSDLVSALQDGGGDARCSTDEAGSNQVPVKVINVVTDANPVNAECQIYFLIPSVSSSVDTYMYLWGVSGGGDTLPAKDSIYGSDGVHPNYSLVAEFEETYDSPTFDDLHDSSPTAEDLPIKLQNGNLGTVSGFIENGSSHGSDGFVDTDISRNHVGELTISAMVKFDSLSSGSFQDFWGGRDGAGGGINTLGRTGDANNKIKFFWQNPALHSLSNNTALSTGTWYHIADIRGGSAGNWDHRIMVNGVSDGYASGITGSPVGNANTRFGIGLSGYVSSPFNGDIDCFRMIESKRTEASANFEFNVLVNTAATISMDQPVLVAGEPATPTPVDPTLNSAPAQLLGTWNVKNITAGETAVFGLEELREERNTKLPNSYFTVEEYPKIDAKNVGKPKETFLGKVKGMTARLIDSSTFTFTYAVIPSISIQRIYTSDETTISPTTTTLGSSEFTWTSYDGEDIFVDATALYPNAVDSLFYMRTSTDWGASSPAASLDTSSTGKGYGTFGARLKQIYGTKTDDSSEANEFAIGLYINEVKPLSEWVKLIKNAACLIEYTDRASVFQCRSWEPVPSEGLLEIRTEHVIGKVVPQINTSDAVTKCVVFYDKNHSTGVEQIYEYENDELRQKRKLSSHAVRELHLPLSDLFGARYRAQREVESEGRPRWTLPLKVTQQFSQLEPGEFVMLNYQEDVAQGQKIKTICEVHEAKYSGDIIVDLVLRDVRGFRDRPGFWVGDSPTFPASLGGASITGWDDGWSDDQKEWARLNVGFWTDDNGYCDLTPTDDPFYSYKGSVWI